jgi:hypothetical protein
MMPQVVMLSNQLVFTRLITGVSSGEGGILPTRPHWLRGPPTLLYSGYCGISGDKVAWACIHLGAFLAGYRFKFVAAVSFGVHSVSGDASTLAYRPVSCWDLEPPSAEQRGILPHALHVRPCSFDFFFPQISVYTFFVIMTRM